MGILDWLLIAAIAAVVAGASWARRQNRKKGNTCCGDCSGCSCGCGK